MANANSDDIENIIESYRLFHLLRQTADTIHKTRDIELKKYNITPEQSAALIGIHSLGKKATPAELSRWLFRERNTITILLNRMHGLGLINKKTDTDRKNIIRLSLTKKGYACYKHAIKLQSLRPVIDALPKKKRDQLWALLQIIRLKIFEDLQMDTRPYSYILDKPILIDTDNPSKNQKKKLS